MLRKISLTSATNTKWKPSDSYIIIIVLKKHLTLSVMSIYSSPRYEKMYTTSPSAKMCLCKLLLGKIKTDFLPLTISLVYEKMAELSRQLLRWFYSQICLDDISHKHSQSLYYTNILYLLGYSWGTGIKHILRCLKFCLYCTHVSTKAT